MSPFSKATKQQRLYWYKGEAIALLGPQDIPGWAFVTHADPARNTFFGLRFKTLRSLPRA